MDRRNIDSSMIRSIGHDDATSTLEIEFNNGQVWQYYDFPVTLWHEFDGTESHGKFFHAQIKKQYRENQVA
ncbi:KTSC domain-containing protein [Herminiimonas fonticola]|uniref:KTSC domain-containing protein n=1 Tax=Herminiimonas fonticola TaxID=303380 RepID=A0A4R6GG26_9BURK|nr:KTSC domain-containing protein [Herminiimonas fonticola]RBA24755.1 KTSC domain [Herminiimonas fonticola]TDN93869.1 KTSC domain-containing protein [Herminiimonas fonticola]